MDVAPITGGIHSKRMDPAVHLNEECMVQVFSFVGGRLASGVASSIAIDGGSTSEETETTEESVGLCISEAFSCYELLASVSWGWKAIVDKHSRHLYSDLCVNFEAIPIEHLEFFTDWTCLHKFRVKSILCYSGDCQKAATRILRDCDTSKLTLASIVIPANESAATTDKEDSPSNEGQQHLMLQEALAQECPELETLCFQLVVNQNDLGSDFMNPALFALPSITSLVVSVSTDCCVLDDEMIFSRLIQGFPNLQKLELESNQESFCERSNPVIFHIASTTLEHLYVPSLCTEFVYLSLDCPSLQLFICAGDATPEDRNILRLKQTVLSAESVTESCLGAIRQEDSDEQQLECFEFRKLLG
ncbi:expressed unknown protein [Seminavis robusta]|uniref:Uncharacterized protein n=1 Tax=Seminavis robusta TaxID=568900 RepID=A0A9N8E1N5_9STRA|nr:expressed unknown protein [Seminavis robusta]|eukprot:Sro417_g138780.1 n/a (361) ;mRNA; r:51887-52969